MALSIMTESKNTKCPTCNQVFPRTEQFFHKRKDGYKGLNSRCKECAKKKSKKHRSCDSVKLKQRDTHYKKLYKISLEEYQTLFSSQSGKCAICGEEEVRINPLSKKVQNLCVDHSPLTGEVRGLLCHSCNVGLGNFKDNLLFLRAATKYLEKYND